MKAEVFWYRTRGLAANALEPGDPGDITLEGSVIVDLPDGLADRLNAATDSHAGIVDEIINHLRATGQTVPAIPKDCDQ